MKRDATPRARVRAHSLLLSEQRMKIKEIAMIYQVDRDTVATWIKKWEQIGVESLYDQQSFSQVQVYTFRADGQ